MVALLLMALVSTPFQADTSVVARVGRFTITAEELLSSYDVGPAFVRRRQDPLRQHLEFMVDERLLAIHAMEARLDTTAFVRDRQAGLTEDLAVEALYRDEILSRARPDESQIVRDIRSAITTVWIRWLHHPRDDEARALWRSIRSGASFDSLYAAQTDTASSSGSRRMESTLLRLERDRPAVAAAIARVRVGETSEPVRGPDGTYLFHLDRVASDPILTETRAAMVRREVASLRTSIIADSLADAYVKSMMREAEPVIKGDGFNVVRALIADRGLSRDTRVAWEIPTTYWTEAGPQPISMAGTMMDRPLVTFGSRSFSVRDYARWYDLRQFQFDTRSLAAFNSSVKRTIWKMVQDRLLSERAAEQGIFARAEVVRGSETWQAKILYLAGRAHVLRGITITDADLRTRYDRERPRFRDRSGIERSFESVREELWAATYGEREVKILRDTLAACRRRVRVWIDERAVRKLAESIAPEPHPIEAVFYKPGGTFPRVAFPTIDEAWERMP